MSDLDILKRNKWVQRAGGTVWVSATTLIEPPRANPVFHLRATAQTTLCGRVDQDFRQFVVLNLRWAWDYLDGRCCGVCYRRSDTDE